MLSRLDYGNATLVGLPVNILNRLQSVFNAATRLLAGLQQSDHITALVDVDVERKRAQAIASLPDSITQLLCLL